MIPNLMANGKQSSTTPWIKTEADDELKDCKNLTCTVYGREYPIWKYIEMYCPIQDKNGRKVALRMNSAQIATYKLWDRQMGELGYIRCNEGKGRQMGSSTLIAAFLWTMLLTHPGYKVGILADTEAKGVALLQKYRFFYRNSPEGLRQELEKACVTDNSHEITFDYGSGITSGAMVIVAGENAGASYTFQALHDSEVALWERIDATLMALEQTVGDVPGTVIIRETTARGPNEWKGHYEAGKNHRSEFRSIFLAWYMEKSYSKKYDGHELTEYERFLRDELKLSLNQIQWWKEKLARAKGDLAYIKQEYPSTEAEMWQSTSVSIFDAEITSRRKEETENKWLKKGVFEFDRAINSSEEFGSDVRLENPRFVLDEIGAVTIFEEPIDGHPYALANDPANEGDDYHATIVVDCSNCHQVATYHKQKVDMDMAAFQSYCLWDYYKRGPKGDMDNRVFVTGERNITKYWLHMMERLGAGPISRDRSESESSSALDHLGWRTGKDNRANMISEFQIAFRESNGEIVSDYDTLCEMESFQYKKSGLTQTAKAQAIGGAHDDLVMAYCGFFHCLSRGDFECDVRLPKRRRIDVPFDPFRKNVSRAKDGRFIDW